MATKSYAGFGHRFLAVLLDGLILGVASTVLRKLISFDMGYYVLSTVLAWGYAVYFIGSSGQTLGKKALGIKVVKADGSKLTYMDAGLREIPGKMVSSFLLGIGYFWMLWDGKKQTFHDKIASTNVVKA